MRSVALKTIADLIDDWCNLNIVSNQLSEPDIELNHLIERVEEYICGYIGRFDPFANDDVVDGLVIDLYKIDEKLYNIKNDIPELYEIWNNSKTDEYDEGDFHALSSIAYNAIEFINLNHRKSEVIDRLNDLVNPSKAKKYV